VGNNTERYLNATPILIIMQAEEALKLIKQYQRELELEEIGFLHKFLE
jgi:hypothetical protein